MALKALHKICENLSSDLLGISILHRVGRVPCKEPSVIIVAVSPHRRAAIEATSNAIDMLKKTVPIWKKEHYSDESCLDEWK